MYHNVCIPEHGSLGTRLCKNGWEMPDRFCHVNDLALFPGLPTIQFLIACSMRKQRGKAWYVLSHERTSSRPYLVVSTLSAEVSNVRKVKNVPFLAKCVLSIGNSSPLCLPR